MIEYGEVLAAAHVARRAARQTALAVCDVFADAARRVVSDVAQTALRLLAGGTELRLDEVEALVAEPTDDDTSDQRDLHARYQAASDFGSYLGHFFATLTDEDGA